MASQHSSLPQGSPFQDGSPQDMSKAARRSRPEMIEETRAKLIEAARHAFAEKGFNNASMDDFTAKVSLTRGALYHHFGDKKGLLIAVINQIDEEIDAHMLEATSGETSLLEVLRIETRVYLESMLDPEIQQIVMRDGTAVLGDISSWPSQAKYHDMLAETLAKLMQDGTIKQCDCYALARQLNGALYGVALWIANDKNPQSAFDKAWDAITILLNGLLAKTA